MEDTAQLLSNDGTLIDTIEVDGFQVSLYKIDSAYYEVFYSLTDHSIVKVVQATKEDMEKYLETGKPSLPQITF